MISPDILSRCLKNPSLNKVMAELSCGLTQTHLKHASPACAKFLGKITSH